MHYRRKNVPPGSCYLSTILHSIISENEVIILIIALITSSNFWCISKVYRLFQFQWQILTVPIPNYDFHKIFFVQIAVLADAVTSELHRLSTHKIWKFRKRQVDRRRQSNKLQSWSQRRPLNCIAFGKERLRNNQKFLQNIKLLPRFSYDLCVPQAGTATTSIIKNKNSGKSGSRKWLNAAFIITEIK
jgi:hypothetical protein